MKYFKPGTKVWVKAYKLNGVMYRHWKNIIVIKHNSDNLLLANTNAYVTELNGRNWHTVQPSVWLFQINKWRNALGILNNEKISYYVNLASPYYIIENVVHYIDYDLDFRVFDNGSYKVLDVSEFIANATKMNYSNFAIDSVLAEFYSTEQEIINKSSFFNREKIIKYLSLFEKIIENKYKK